MAVVVACVAVQLAYVLSSVPLRSANDRSRWATVRALVEDGSYVIDRFQVGPNQRDKTWATIDLARHDGHFYSTKPPVLPTLVARLLGGVTVVTGWTLAEDPVKATRATLVLLNVVPMALALAAIAWIGRRTVGGVFGPVVAVLASGVATMHLPFVATLNNHTIALWAAALTLAATLRIETATCVRQQRLAAVVAGLLAMWTCCNELPAAAFGLTVFGWLWSRQPRLAWGWFASAALVPLAFFFWTNYAATGGWKPLYMYYGTEKYEFDWNGRPSYWKQPQGIDRNLDSPATYALHCLVGHHGLFSLTPLLLAAAAGVFGLRRRNEAVANDSPERRWLRFWATAGAVLSVVVLGFFLTRTGNYNYGGVSVALRWMLWLTPLWSLLLLVACDRFDARWFRVVVIALAALSIASATASGPNPWQQNWLFDAMTEAGWIDYG